jgi:uncharacterized protein (TIGR03083 family)
MSTSIPWEALGPPLDVRPLLQPLRDALVEVLADRRPTEWQAPTTPGWTVADTVGHLLGDDLGRIARTRDHHHGVAPAEGEDLPAFLDRLNQEWVVAARRLSPRLLLELLAHTGKLVRAQWAGHDLEEEAEAVSWAGVDPAPLWLDMARDYTEYWIHQAQVREALGEPLLDDPGFMEPLVSTLVRCLPHTLRDLAPSDGEATLTIEVTDLSPGDWHLTATPDGWRFVAAVGHPDTLVRWGADTLWRVASRMIDPVEARARAHVEGDLDVGAAVTSMLAIIRPA